MSTPSSATPAAGTSPQQAAGVIHDIGYRHYAGTRLGRQSVVRSLFVDSLRGAFGLGRSGKSKIAPFLLLAVICVPALGVAIVANVTPTTELPFPFASYPLLVYVPLCLYVAGQAPASVSRDLRYRTTSLYFSRPLRRTDYVSAKFLALTCAVALVLLVPLLVLLGGLLLSTLPKDDTLTSFAQGLAAIALLSPMLAGIGLALASVTPRRGLGVAAVAATLLVLWGIQGAVQGIMFSEGRDDLSGWSLLISPGTMVDSVTTWAFDITGASGATPTRTQGLLALVAVAVVAAGSYLFLQLRYRKVSVS